jgi:hypothetical protein
MGPARPAFPTFYAAFAWVALVDRCTLMATRKTYVKTGELESSELSSWGDFLVADPNFDLPL